MEVVEMLARGYATRRGRRGALIHHDSLNHKLRARKGSRLSAIVNGGAIPEVFDYRVLLEPEGHFLGTLNEDFAIESLPGDVFQLGNTSWRILRIGNGTVRVADAQGQPPSMPFWLGEAPARSEEMSVAVSQLRAAVDFELPGPDEPRKNMDLLPAVEFLKREYLLSQTAAEQIATYLAEGKRSLGTVPTMDTVALERFFDESGGMQLVLHAPFGGRINRAWGLALRKRFCRGFGFELQAAANEEAIVISLGQQHSFALSDVFDYLHPNSVKELLTQAILDQPMFESRWRWNASRSLMLERFQNGKPVPPQLLRMRAGDLLALTFPAAVACPETMPPGDLPIPMEHPLVRQTIEDCLTESTDVKGLIKVLEGLRDGSIERVAVDTAEPSAFARGILNSELYTFLDDAPLEERRTQAVLSRRTLDERQKDSIGALDPAAVQRVREEAWPEPESVEEMHDALLWMGFVADEEAAPWIDYLMALKSQGRVEQRDGRWFAVDGLTEPKKILLGRLEALGPVEESDPRIAMADKTSALLMELEHEGSIMRTRLEGRQVWCERRLLARIHRYTIDKLRSEIAPVNAS